MGTRRQGDPCTPAPLGGRGPGRPGRACHRPLAMGIPRGKLEPGESLHQFSLRQARFRNVAAPCKAAHSCWRQSNMHAMDNMDVPASIKIEDGQYGQYGEYDEHKQYEQYDDVEVLRVSGQSRS